MRRPSTTTFAGALVATAMLALTACGDDGATAHPPLAGGASPLEQALGISFDPTSAGGSLESENRRIEEAVAECMKAQGFEYTPNTAGVVAFGTATDPATEGFGITTGFDQLIGGDGAADPNQERLAEMDPAQRQAYEQALYGDFPDPGETTSGPVAFEPGGCYGEAFADSAFSVFDTLGPDLEALAERVQADPRVVELDRAWAECMGEKGYEFARRDDAPQSILDRFDEFQTSVFADLPPVDAPTGSSSGDGAVVFGPPELTAGQRAELDELQAEEIRIAVADAACAEGYDDAIAEVRVEYEQEFVDEHRDALDEAGGR